jgi:hypothetical protein
MSGCDLGAFSCIGTVDVKAQRLEPARQHFDQVAVMINN